MAPDTPELPPPIAPVDGRARTAATISLVVGIFMLVAKFVAWALTDSTAVLSDALESIVNVSAAAFALYSVRLAEAPPDKDHPYGHGKVEFLSAAFEGGLIVVAGGLIVWEAAQRLIEGGTLSNLGPGVGIVVGAAVVHAVLGVWLVRVGEATGSLALEADGKHLLTDVWTSVAVAVGLGVVWATGLQWLDPVVAIFAALNILRIGVGLFRQAVGGMMDEADHEDLERVEQALSALEEPLLHGWDDIRSRHQGRLHHVDLTIYVPGEISVGEAHDLADRVEAVISEALGEAEVICHVEPEALA